ncbi:hypothetical protein DYU11_09885 [Fibrisoma montanum]|uniref:Uncharacterized protein n=1 Tax=Fibrisoma montanum TaxID=2305895 RepID=A0A418MFK0_9BACT|nr:hypothetical protein [Fibrisoma montanum]RIV25589.1 hypothetical protein DYU11_09885 [Fibrisoma montanum]
MTTFATPITPADRPTMPINGRDYLPVVDPALPGPIDNDVPLPPVNLYAVGYEKAEQHRGNALALENLLNRVLRGYLVDERNDDARRQQHHREIDQQVLTLEKQAEEVRTEVRKINQTQLPALEASLEQLDKEILQIRKDQAAGLRNPSHLDRVKLRFYGGLTLLATLFVYLFYVSAFYSAFYRDLAGELQAAGTSGQAGILAAIFARTAFVSLDFHWAGPLLLFAFGGMLHVLIEHKTWVGRVLLGLLLLVLAGTDGLIAYFVESKNHDVKVLMGLADVNQHQWWASPVFWLVIAMGYVAALVWSGLLHAWMHEYGKKDVAKLVALDIQHRLDRQRLIREQITTLKASLTDLDGHIARLELDIKALQARRQSVMFSPSELEKYVTDFYDGWLTYVNNRMGNDALLRAACDEVVKAFYAQHLNRD